MLPDRFALTAIGALCVAAAGTGGYVALRQAPVNPESQLAVQGGGPTSPSAGVEPAAAAKAVEETEGVLDSAKPKTAPPAPPTPAEPARRPPQQATASAAPEKRAPAPVPVPERRQVARAENTMPPAAPRANTMSPAAPRASAPEPPAAAPPPPEPEPIVQPQPLTAQPIDRIEPPPAPELPQRLYDELVVAADSVIGLQTETPLTSERARIEDRVEARVVRDVRVGGRVAIPAGTRVVGSVMLVERVGRLRERARLGIRFHTLAMADGTRVPITTETIYRYGDAPGNGSAAKIGGGAVAGAILGAILGGGKGAAIGATAGATGGGAAVAAGDRSEAKVPVGAEVTARILSPVTITVDQ